MRVMLLGSGGREHAMALALAQSAQCEALGVAPGNAGTAAIAENLALNPTDPEAVLAAARRFDAELMVIGPEAPLAAGVSDMLRAQGIRVFGPSRAAARLESSKAFANEVCDAAGIPTAAWQQFDAVAPALQYLSERDAPIVVKADGLAAGKGVVVASTRGEAEAAVRDMLGGAMGAAGARVIIESFLPGVEASLFAICDESDVVLLGTARDYKRAFDQDIGPNTGGMGAISPAPTMGPELEAATMERVVLPCLREMANRGTPYSGVLYVGLMIHEGEPAVVEFNARLGDPEAQGVLTRLQTDLLEIANHVATNSLNEIGELQWDDRHTVTVVMASEGYPGAYESNTEIRGLEKAEAQPDVVIHHAGTKSEDGRVLAVGGRVLNITGLGRSIAQARERAYAAVNMVDWPAGFCRRDIGLET